VTQIRPSTQLGAVSRNVDRIERRRSANEQAIEFGTAEGHVRDQLGNENFADQCALGVIAVDALNSTAFRSALAPARSSASAASMGREAGRQVIYGLVIILMLLVYGRSERVTS
jgi:hypothetical protein